MDVSPRGRAVVARARRSIAWSALAALWVVQGVGLLPGGAVSSSSSSLRDGATEVRADIWDDIIEEIFGNPDDPPPDEDPPTDPPTDPETW